MFAPRRYADAVRSALACHRRAAAAVSQAALAEVLGLRLVGTERRMFRSVRVGCGTYKVLQPSPNAGYPGSGLRPELGDVSV